MNCVSLSPKKKKKKTLNTLMWSQPLSYNNYRNTSPSISCCVVSRSSSKNKKREIRGVIWNNFENLVRSLSLSLSIRLWVSKTLKNCKPHKEMDESPHCAVIILVLLYGTLGPVIMARKSII